MPGETYKHYKGGRYKVITLANHSETKEPMVVYQSLSFGSTHVRPLEMWDDEIEIPAESIEGFGEIKAHTVKRFQKY